MPRHWLVPFDPLNVRALALGHDVCEWRQGWLAWLQCRVCRAVSSYIRGVHTTLKPNIYKYSNDRVCLFSGFEFSLLICHRNCNYTRGVLMKIITSYICTFLSSADIKATPLFMFYLRGTATVAGNSGI